MDRHDLNKPCQACGNLIFAHELRMLSNGLTIICPPTDAPGWTRPAQDFSGPLVSGTRTKDG